jgi:hypothetical protein
MAAVRTATALVADRRLVAEGADHMGLMVHRKGMELHTVMEQEAARTVAAEEGDHRPLQEAHHKVAVGLETHIDEVEAAEEGNLPGAAAEDNMVPGLLEVDIGQLEGVVVRSNPG